VELTQQCIDSIVSNTPEFNEIQFIIVDNASTDRTSDYLASLMRKFSNIEVISNSENLGFAKGCNQGIKIAKSNYVVLLNNDTVVTKGWLSSLIREAESSPDIGIVGSRLLYPNSNIIQHIGVKVAKMKLFYPYHFARLRDQKYAPEANFSSDYDCVTFACVLIKKEVFDRIGLLDEEYINSYEDVDFCVRAREAGFRIRYCADSILYHFESKTPNRHKYDQQNLELLNKKWEIILDKYVDKEKSGLEIWEVWIREELQKNPNDIISLHQLSNIISQMNRYEEYQIVQKEFDQKIAEFRNTQPIISIIIPTHNNWQFSFTCIQKIFSSMKQLNYEVIIVDNNSTDVTVNNLKLMEALGFVRVIYNNPERTYAQANNEGAKIARGKFFVFMNNDVLLFENWSEKLVEIFEQHPEIGIQGAKLLYPNRLIQHSGIVFRRLRNGMKYHYHIYLGKQEAEACVSKSREFQAVTGAFLAIRRELFEHIGGFDEFYNFGHEDLDLCIAVRKLGYKVWYNAEIRAIHLESMTKKIKGLEKFALKFNDPNNNDYKNYVYFHRKWGDFIEIDDYKYYQEDNEFNPFVNV
jgi:GT2 family glycosyltransferase